MSSGADAFVTAVTAYGAEEWNAGARYELGGIEYDDATRDATAALAALMAAHAAAVAEAEARGRAERDSLIRQAGEQGYADALAEIDRAVDRLWDDGYNDIIITLNEDGWDAHTAWPYRSSMSHTPTAAILAAAAALRAEAAL